MTDTGGFWHETFWKNLKGDLRMRLSREDLSLYFRKDGGKLTGVMGSYVDDTIETGNNTFEDERLLTGRKFKSVK